MTIGGGIALIVIGAILAFAIHLENSFIDLQLIGYILMVAGAIVTILGLVLLGRRRQTVTTDRTLADPVTGESVRSRVTEADDPLPPR